MYLEEEGGSRVIKMGKGFDRTSGATNAQTWLFRNSHEHVHYKKLDGLTEKQHEEIFDKVKDFMFTDLAELLPKHQHLLELDFAKLGNGSTTEHQYWTESMESALIATDHIIEGGETMNIRRALQPAKRKRRHNESTARSMSQITEDEGFLV